MKSARWPGAPVTLVIVMKNLHACQFLISLARGSYGYSRVCSTLFIFTAYRDGWRRDKYAHWTTVNGVWRFFLFSTTSASKGWKLITNSSHLICITIHENALALAISANCPCDCRAPEIWQMMRYQDTKVGVETSFSASISVVGLCFPCPFIYFSFKVYYPTPPIFAINQISSPPCLKDGRPWTMVPSINFAFDNHQTHVFDHVGSNFIGPKKKRKVGILNCWRCFGQAPAWAFQTYA